MCVLVVQSHHNMQQGRGSSTALACGHVPFVSRLQIGARAAPLPASWTAPCKPLYSERGCCPCFPALPAVIGSRGSAAGTARPCNAMAHLAVCSSRALCASQPYLHAQRAVLMARARCARVQRAIPAAAGAAARQPPANDGGSAGAAADSGSSSRPPSARELTCQQRV